MPIVEIGIGGQELVAAVSETDVVLDLGGGANPWPRANWVIDLFPYEYRYEQRQEKEDGERFTRDTWIQRDVCDREPLLFNDKELDFVTCMEVLEDVRDPLWVCSEMIRIAKRGYITVPHRDLEGVIGVSGWYFTGYFHHRWFVELIDNVLTFTFKTPFAYLEEFRRDEFKFKHLTFLWEDSFEYRENFLLSREAYMEDLRRYAKWREEQIGKQFFGRTRGPTKEPYSERTRKE